jgi:uncharacterized protein
MPTISSARPWYPDSDPVHGFDHILRVYRLAERMAAAEGADLEIVRAAALLHDASEDIHTPTSNKLAAGSDQTKTTEDQRANHHHASASFAHKVLQAEGWSEERIAAVEHCIRSHRFRDNREPPESLEAKILFDADKLDAIGAIGAARAIGYAVLAGQPIFAQPSKRFFESGEKETGEAHSSYHEYVFKLSKLKERLLTPTGRAIAEGRHRFLVEYYRRLAAEIAGEE